jgi:1-phosphofructokinase family hexose kinase
VILAAGLTPAWQQIMRFARLRPGEVNRAAEVHWCASGKNLNVGMALAALEAEAVTLSPLGGWSGQAIAAEFARDGHLAMWTSSGKPTRVCTTLLDEATGSATELVENAAPLTEGERAEFIVTYQAAAAEAELLILTGSLPHGTPTTFYRDLLRQTPCPVVVDVRGAELLAALECRPRVVKPNREELGWTLGRPLTDTVSVLAAMRELIERGAGAVVVTQGKEAVWVAEPERTWQIVPPTVAPVVNPIGCGDCLAAGLAVGLSRGLPLIEAVRLGMAAAAANVTQLLPARLDQASVQAWHEQIVPREYTG